MSFELGRGARRLVLGLLLVLIAAAAGAQTLTTVAVFDMQDVLVTFYQDSAAVREFQQAQQEYQNDLRRAEQTLNDYQQRRASALDRNDSRTAQRLREDIEALQEDIIALQEQWLAQQQQLEDELAGDEFFNRLWETVGFVAEDNGYTAVLDISAMGTALFWYSPEIDITEDVITEMLARFR
mgnify:CR=1 FL=1